MLCLKKKKFWGSSSSYGPQSQSKSFGLEQGNGISSEDGNRRVTRNNSRATDMAPPPSATQAVHPVVREVTEDTPPDLLEGTMDLMVVLPTGKTVQTTVDRKIPMMDLLIHIATANKINPAGHIVQVRNERGIEMPYKPSTPIGALDTTTIEIVPKNRVNEYIIVKKPAKVANQPFETTFRLQVHLPRNQLYVIRISPRTVLDDILREVCQEKNLDISKYEIRHPVHLDQKLPLSATVGETGLQEITVVSKNHKVNSSVSTADIIAIQQQQSDGKGCLDGSFKHSRSSVGDSSVSSESTASGSGSGRGISPCRSEDSRSISPLPLIRPKTLFPSRTTSNISTCSSSGNSSGVHSKSKTLHSSLSMSSQISHQQVVMQAPPRTKKRAAPKPPSCTPDSRANSVNSPVSEKGTPLPNNAENSSRTSGTPLERPPSRKKEAPREPPKQHAPLSHHQSLPINHGRQQPGNVDCRQQEVASFQQNRQDFRQLDRVPELASTSKMSGKQSSSMTNLTSVSSVSSSSLASSTGGLSKKRRAPKPPVLATLSSPPQIEEETTNTDSETSTLHGADMGGSKELDRIDKQPVQVGKEDVMPDHVRHEDARSASLASTLSSPSISASDSNPVPSTMESSATSKSTPSVVMMKGERSTNTNHDIEEGEAKRDVANLDESGSSKSRSSSIPSSSNNVNNIIAPASPDSVRSRKLSSVEVEETVTSSRPPSSNTQEESQNEAACHSSESEASYTDSGVPATETVTPSPVNLDDVILDQDYHAGSHPEKFHSEEDGDELKHSSRRSSIQSDHSEEWMNVLETKLNKDEEAIEKMFDAVLPKSEDLSGKQEEEGTDGRDNERVMEEAEPNFTSREDRTEKDISLELDRNNDRNVNDARSELLETTVELHSAPEKDHNSEMEDGNGELSELTTASSAAAPVRKLSKSESFSHNSEFNEAKERRKNFHTGRSNAFQNSSGGSAVDLRHSEVTSDYEEELVSSLPGKEKKVDNVDAKPHNHVRDDRTVSMTDLTSATDYKGSAADDVGQKKLVIDGKTSVQKATSLQQLSENESRDGSVAVDVYRKQLEMQFEQWKEEFMKTHTKPNEEVKAPTVTDQAEVVDAEQTVAEQQVEEEEVIEENATQLNADRTDQVTDTTEDSAEQDEGNQILDRPASNAEINEGIKAPTREEIRAEVSHPVEIDRTTASHEKSTEEEVKMNRREESHTVELRKKENKPSVVYQYTGPPTIKMGSYNEGPRRQVSVKMDDDYIMGYGQQDPNAKATNPGRIHSFHGGPIVPITPSQTDNKIKRESSPNPSSVTGWSKVLNAPNIMPGSTGAVRSVLSTWKQREETVKEKNKPKEGPPAEIDIYGTENIVERQVQTKSVVTKTIQNGSAPSTEKTAAATNGNVMKQMEPKPAKALPKVSEKSNTIGSSFRSDKPVIFTMNHMDSNTLPRNKTSSPSPAKPSVDVVDSKPKVATSTVEITSSSSLQDRKNFFQGIKPVENGKEAPIPATNLKSNIAAIQKVFEKQRMTKMQQMGSQQSLHSDGAVSPVPGLQRNDSLESRQSNSLQRRNSVESHSSDSSSVVLRVSQQSSGKASPQMSANEMVHKLFGRPNSFNMDPSRRTPSPISSTTSTLSSSASYDRFTPSPTVIDGPNNSVRITTGGYRPPSNQAGNIRSVGNKAIIIVNGDDTKRSSRDIKPLRKEMSTVNEIILDEGSNKLTKSPVSSTYVSAIAQQQNKRDSVVPPAPSKKLSKEPIIVEKNARNVQSDGAPPPPPPPPVDGATNGSRSNLSLDVKRASLSSNNSRGSKQVTPTSPSSPDPRAEIFNAIKNSNGNFGLRKTGSSVLLK